MNVILMQKIRNLGELGDQVQVKAGYARNYLLPKGQAVLASKDNISYFEHKREELEKAAKERTSQCLQRADKINGMVITIKAQVGDEGKLYGSVGTLEIVEAVKEQSVEIARNEIQLPDGPLRVIGEHKVKLHLQNDDIIAELIINVIASE